MYESFSQDVKNEICASRLKNRCCRASLLRGMIVGANATDQDCLFFESENPSVVMHYARLIKEFTGRKRDSDISLAAITDTKLIKKLCDALEADGICDFGNSFIKCEECARSFIKGAFLSCGTVTYPENSYHMEFLVRGKERASLISGLLTELGMQPKTTERRGDFYGVYFKDSESVVDILGHLGANKAAFKMLDVKMYKDLRNNINRVNNCEIANQGKTLAASDGQMRAIQRIIESGKADELPDELKMTLDLRAAFPEATLLQLAEMHTPPITKSGVNHRLKRILLFSEKLSEV